MTNKTPLKNKIEEIVKRKGSGVIHYKQDDLIKEISEEAQKLMDETLNDFCEELKEKLTHGGINVGDIDKLKKKHGEKA